MRALIFLLIVAVILVVAALATGFVNIARVGGQAAEVNAEGAKAPAFDVETGSVKVGTKQTTVKVPSLVVQKAGHDQPASATTNNAM